MLQGLRGALSNPRDCVAADRASVYFAIEGIILLLLCSSVSMARIWLTV